MRNRTDKKAQTASFLAPRPSRRPRCGWTASECFASGSSAGARFGRPLRPSPASPAAPFPPALRPRPFAQALFVVGKPRLFPCGVEMQVQDPDEAPSVEERQRDPLDQTFGLRQLRRLPFLFRQRLLFLLLNPLLFSGRDYNFAWLARRRSRTPFADTTLGPAASFPTYD